METTNTCLSIKKKLYIFDFDNTLLLHYLHSEKRFIYEKKLFRFLKKLKLDNKLLTIVTHNKDPFTYLKANNILYLFDIIKTPYEIPFKDYHPEKFPTKNYKGYHGVQLPPLYSISDKICIYPPKPDMISEILSITGVSKNESIFFDDDRFHVEDVKLSEIESVLIDPLIGIPENILKH
jgi:hypothetical protein